MQWRRRVEWTPNELDWWIAALFIAGSLLFLVGSFPPYSQLVDGRLLGTTFVVGSVFFTAAAYIAVIQVINDGSDASTPRKLWAWSPRGALWWAAVIQLVGIGECANRPAYAGSSCSSFDLYLWTMA